jgi:hypothetical protein
VALDLSSFKCGHDAPMYSMIEEIVESSGTPYFTFHDIDENKPTGSIKIRVETIAYFLGRYQDEMREKSEMEQRIKEAVRAYEEALRRGETPPEIDLSPKRAGVVIPLGIAMSGGSAREGGSCGSGGCGDGCGDSCGTGGGCGTSTGGCGSGGCGDGCGTAAPTSRFAIADDLMLPVLSGAPGPAPATVTAKSEEFYVPLTLVG